jgi:hypothetical protein
VPTTVSPPRFDFIGQTKPERRGGHTLEDRLERAWEGVLAEGTAACPVCRARLERHGAEGRCGGCGSTLT